MKIIAKTSNGQMLKLGTGEKDAKWYFLAENVVKFAATIEVGEETLKEVQGGVAAFKPFIRYHTFDDFSINFTVILRCKEFVDNYLIKHEFIKRLHERYNKEDIIIPFPIRDVYIKENKA